MNLFNKLIVNLIHINAIDTHFNVSGVTAILLAILCYGKVIS